MKRYRGKTVQLNLKVGEETHERFYEFVAFNKKILGLNSLGEVGEHLLNLAMDGYERVTKNNLSTDR